MIRAILTTLGFALIACLLGACGVTQSSPTPTPAVTRLTMADANTTVTLRRDALIEIALDGNPSTGFTWTTGPDGGALLAPQGDPTFQPTTAAPGSGGTMTLRFRAVTVGSGAFALVYQRPFETTTAPAQTFLINLIVTE